MLRLNLKEKEMENNIILTICVCSVLERSNTFLPNILKQLEEQLNYDDVEILILIDNKKTALGTKRNDMVTLAQGKYVTFIDDDDDIKNNYIDTLRTACYEYDVDVINFDVDVTINDEPIKKCHYSLKYGFDYNTNTEYFRIPNHIMCVKKDLIEEVKFKPIIRGEDADYSKRLLPKLKTEKNLNIVLYHYKFNINTTVTQKKTNR